MVCTLGSPPLHQLNLQPLHPLEASRLRCGSCILPGSFLPSLNQVQTVLPDDKKNPICFVLQNCSLCDSTSCGETKDELANQHYLKYGLNYAIHQITMPSTFDLPSTSNIYIYPSYG